MKEAARRQWAIDGVIVAIAALLQVGGTWAAADHQGRQLPLGGAALLTLGALLLLGRRRYPTAVLWLTSGVALAYWSASWPRGPVFAAQIIALASAVIAGRRRAAIAVVVAGYVTFQWLPPLVGTHRGPGAAQAIALAAWLLALLAGSEWLRARRQRASALAARHEEEARRVATEERLRIARELHDVLAHNISLINVQASTALHLGDREPERAQQALETIKATSKEALVELRSVLGALRQVDEAAPRSPGPTLDRLDDLANRTTVAGVRLHVERDDHGALPRPVDQAAFRIVQEALTNVARHAGATTATVRITTVDEDLVVQIDDDGSGGSGIVTNGGHGIAGMRERARALGGTLDAGPRPDGGFRVRARLPIVEPGA